MKLFLNRRIRPVLFLSMILLAVMFLASCKKPASAQDRISATLSALGVTDAKFTAASYTPELTEPDSILYTSAATQLAYYFDPDTGALRDIFDYSMLGSGYRENAEASPALTPMEVDPADPEKTLLEYARACIGDDLIGTLRLRTDQDQGLLLQYTVAEYYDGIGTGTCVVFTTDADGRIEMCNVTIGSIFEPAGDGTYVISGKAGLIGEEAAIQTAREGLQALDMEKQAISDEASCELTAAEDFLIYVVRIGFTDGKGQQRQYLAYVHASTGELWQEGISK